MAINLADKYSSQIRTAYVKESLVAGHLNDEYDFTGVKTVKIVTPTTVPMNNYKRVGTNRYGNPTEMQDTVQEMTMTQDKSFALTIDKGNNADQMNIKGAGKMLKLQLAERAVPEYDKYCLGVMTEKAGFLVGDTTPLSKSNIVDRISAASARLDDMEVPSDGRTLWITANGHKMLRQSEEFLAVDKLAEQSLAKGVVGTFDNMTVIKVPASRWPENVNFIIAHKKAVTAPVKLSETKIHQDPPGISGHLLEGREYYDCFVIAVKANGIYAEIDTGEGKAVQCAAPVISSTGALTCETTGAEIWYTTDGSDPRYSAAAYRGSSAGNIAGTTVKAYAKKNGMYPSELVTKVLG